MLVCLFLLLHFSSFSYHVIPFLCFKLPSNVIVYLVYHPCQKGFYLIPPVIKSVFLVLGSSFDPTPPLVATLPAVTCYPAPEFAN